MPAKQVYQHKAVNLQASPQFQPTSSGMEYSSFLPVIFSSPYIDTDYQIFEGIWANTLAGTAIDTRVEFSLGRGVRPTFVLKDKKIKGDEEKKNALSKFDDILTELEKIDKKPSIKLNTKLPDLERNTHVFGRSILAFETNNGKEKIPIALKPIHPRDIGRVFVHQLDWSLSSVYAFQKTDLIKAEDMLYSVQMSNSPIRRSLHYGFSSIQRLTGQARAVRRINEFDIPEISTSLWAKIGLITVDQDGMTFNDKSADLQTIKNGLKPGGWNLISGKKEEIGVYPLDTEPKVAELVELIDKIERDIIGNFKIPGGLLGREADQTRATMLGKIRLFLSGPVQNDRQRIGEMLREQWYERNLIDLGYGKILDQVDIEVTFEPIIIESWMDNVESMQKLKALIPSLPEDEILHMLDLDDLVGKLKKEPAQPVIAGPKQFNPDMLKEIAEKTNDMDARTKLMSLHASLIQ